MGYSRDRFIEAPMSDVMFSALLSPLPYSTFIAGGASSIGQ